MNVYHKVLNEVKKINNSVEDLKEKVTILENNNSDTMNVPSEDRGKKEIENKELENYIDTLEEKFTDLKDDNIKINDKVMKINEDLEMVKKQINDLVVIIESLMKINK